MDVRRVYDVEIRLLGIVVLVGAFVMVSSLATVVMALAQDAWDGIQLIAVTLSVVLLAVAGAVLLAGSPHLARALGGGDPAPTAMTPVTPSRWLGLGVALIGIYLIASNIPLLIHAIAEALDPPRPFGASGVVIRSARAWIAPAVRLLLGVLLALNQRLVPSLSLALCRAGRSRHESEGAGTDHDPQASGRGVRPSGIDGDRSDERRDA